MTESSPGKRPPALLGWLVVAISLYPITVSFGVLPMDPEQLHVPLWVFGVVGLIFLVAGCMILFGHHSRLNDALAAVFALAAGVVGIWISFWASPDGFSGGLPLLTAEQNVMVARALFGVGSIISFSISVYAVRRAFRITKNS